MFFMDKKRHMCEQKKKYKAVTQIFFLALPLCMLSLAGILGCASSKGGIKSPELPPRHWLEESPGVPIEKKTKLQSAVPNLYNSQKSFSFEDCVYLAIQQSPSLVNSAVDIEIKKLDLTSAVWEYLPEPRMSVRVSSNITRYNESISDKPSNYGETNTEIGFYAAFPNPISTYFNHQARKALLNLAVTTHRKAMGVTILDIAEIYQRLEAQRKILEIQGELIPLTEKVTTFWKKLEAVEGSQGVALNLAQQQQREAALKLERAKIEDTMLRTRLKILSGVDPLQKLNVATKDAADVFKGFDGASLKWEDRWASNENSILLRGQVKLMDYNIMVAWAKYVPNVTLSVNQYPPSGQSQPNNGVEDSFVHVNIDFPLIDWGRRYRGVQKARMSKAQAYQKQAQARTQYSHMWTEAQQEVHLAATSLKIAKTSLEVAKMQETEARIKFKEGLSQYPKLASTQEAYIEARIAYVQAELNYKLAQLRWMDVAGVLKERFIGKPKLEVI